MNVKDSNVTIFCDMEQILNPKLSPVLSVLQKIKNPRPEIVQIIEQIRSGVGEEEKKRLKSQLPVVMYCGEFLNEITIEKNGATYKSCRTDMSLSKHSGLVPIDIDCETAEDARVMFDTLCGNNDFFALWISPSGDGLHGLVKIADPSKHAQHYAALLKKYSFLDSTSRNISRFLFISHDPNIHINLNSDVFYDIAEYKEKSSVLVETPEYYVDYRKLGIACKMVRLAPDGQKHATLLRASNLLGGLISAGRMDENIAYDCLLHEISMRQVDNIELAKKTIKDGLRNGRGTPIHKSDDEFRAVQDEVRVMEGELDFLADEMEDDEYITKFYHGLIAPGLSLGYPSWDDYLLLKESEFYITLAAGHAGKTTFMIWVCFLASVLHGWNFLIYSGENSTALLKITIMQFYIGKPIKDFSIKELSMAKKFVKDNFEFMDSNRLYTYSDIVKNAELITSYKSIKGVVIDPYNSLKVDMGNKGKYVYDYEALSEFLTFTRRQKTSLFLNVHTNTNHQRIRDKDGNPMMPNASDMEGGGVGLNRSDNFLCLNRKIKSPFEWMYTDISVEKVRNKLTGGKPTSKESPLRLMLSRGVEFLDEEGRLPFERTWL